ncbi:MAG TPA: hypothetical protein VJH25_02140 [Candidatus Paceibacterota bacterium]
MKNKKENHVTKSDLKSAVKNLATKDLLRATIEKSERKFISMMGTMEGRLMGNMAEAIGQSEKKMMNVIVSADNKVTDLQFLMTDTRNAVGKIIENIDAMENRIIHGIGEKIDKLDERFVTRREFLGA